MPPKIEKRKSEGRITPNAAPDIVSMDPLEIIDNFGCSDSRLRLLFEAKNLDCLMIQDINVSIQLLRQKKR